jgi:predicted nucleic acid-binding protein
VKTLVDTNVLLDIITQDRAWSSWAEAALRKAAEQSTLAINPIIFAEVSMKFARIEDADAALVDVAREPLPYEAGFLTGRRSLRTRGGEAPSDHPSPTSTWGPTRLSVAWTCLRATPRAIGHTFPG